MCILYSYRMSNSWNSKLIVHQERKAISRSSEAAKENSLFAEEGGGGINLLYSKFLIL